MPLTLPLPHPMITWPLQSNIIRKGKLSNTFGMVRNNGTKAHQGWDFFGVDGVTPVYAVGAGKVQFIDNVEAHCPLQAAADGEAFIA